VSDLQRHMLRMFIDVRRGVGWAGLLLPFVLVLGGLLIHIPVAGSMSAYYHATPNCIVPTCPDAGTGPMRNVFVATLCLIGAALVLMRGFSIFEDIFLDIAGLAVIGVAFFPMDWGPHTRHFNPHQALAITFFLFSGLTCAFCADKTLQELPIEDPAQKRAAIRFYKGGYFSLAVLMAASPVIGHVIFGNTSYGTLITEVVGVFAFGLYWLLKTRELQQSQIVRQIVTGKRTLDRRRLSGPPHHRVAEHN